MLTKQSDVFLPEYSQIVDFTETQIGKCHWTATEIKVEKDIHDVLVNLTGAERHGVFTTLKLFTLYEMKAGAEYWTGRFMKEFKQHECQAMAAAFGMMELAVHKPFYNKINELLNAANASFYTDYVNDPVLKARMECIDSIINHKDPYVSLGAFTLVEGVILYSNFAFLKHFQSLGKNKLMNIVRGINFSVRDENLHAVAGAWVFRQLIKESPPKDWEKLEREILATAETILQHEYKIIDMIFSKGDISGITRTDLVLFVHNRTLQCLRQLGIKLDVKEASSSINTWFYSGINNYQFNDFFTAQGREYVREWNEAGFVW